MSKTKQFGICAICGEPAAMSELTTDGLCPDCEGARLDAIFHNLDADFDDTTEQEEEFTYPKPQTWDKSYEHELRP